jgi:hypothetical protein
MTRDDLEKLARETRDRVLREQRDEFQKRWPHYTPPPAPPAPPCS